MIPLKTVEELIIRHSSIEKDLSTGGLDNKLFAEKSKEYSDLNEIVGSAKDYISFQTEKVELDTSILIIVFLTGTISFEDRTLEYKGKNYTQFTGIDALTSPCGIGSTVRSGILATSYENGNLNAPVKFNVLGVLNKFVGSAINQQEDAEINISQLGKLKSDLLYTTWIYNTASCYTVETFFLQSTNNCLLYTSPSPRD